MAAPRKSPGRLLHFLALALASPHLACGIVTAAAPPPECQPQRVDLGPGCPCSAMPVGPHAALTAAHCVGKAWDCEARAGGSEQDEIVLISKDGGSWKQGSCTRHACVDLAVCYFEEAFPDDEIGRLAVPPAAPHRGAEVLFSGHGCKKKGACTNTKGHCSDRVLRGKARVLDAPDRDDLTFLLDGRGIWGKSAPTSGDSGGPVCTRNPIEVVGIVTETCADCERWKSVAASLSAEKTVDWLCKWTRQEAQENWRIHGLTCPQEDP